MIAHALRADGFDASEDGTGRGTPIIPILEVGSRTGKSTDDLRAGIGIGNPGDPMMFTLQSGKQHAIAFDMRGREGGAMPEGPHETANIRAADGGSSRSYVAFSTKDYGADAGEIAPTARAMNHSGSHANAGGQIGIAAFHENQRAKTTLSDTAGSLKVSGGKPGQGYPALLNGAVVRRLTPRECERLQGFPDDYTMIEYRGKPAADGPRYKALGNSMAVPVMRWLGERIQLIENLL